MIEAGFKIMITSVSCEGLDHNWLGHVLDERSLKELQELSTKHRFNVDGEGGEYETFVLGGPIWSRSLKVEGEEQHSASRGVFYNSFSGLNRSTGECNSLIYNFSRHANMIAWFEHCFQFFSTKGC